MVQGADPLAPILAAARDPANKEAKIEQWMPAGVDKTWAGALSDGQVRLGMIAYMSGDYDTADACFQEAYQLNPVTDQQGSPNPVIFLADYCRNKSLPLPNWALKGGDEEARVALFIGALYDKTSQPKKAEAILSRVAKGELVYASIDQRAEAQDLLGEALYHDDKEKEADGVWREFLKPPLSSTKAAPDALLQLGCTGNDLDALRKCYEWYPRTDEGLSALVQCAYALVCKNQNVEALALMRTASTWDPKDNGWGFRARQWVPLLEEKIKRGGPWPLSEEIAAQDNPDLTKALCKEYGKDMAGNPYPPPAKDNKK
ncbi:MAG: tetratricopeptide repeat protein [Planctomycetota bacterium]